MLYSSFPRRRESIGVAVSTFGAVGGVQSGKWIPACAGMTEGGRLL
jgi:hypothetical protein